MHTHLTAAYLLPSSIRTTGTLCIGATLKFGAIGGTITSENDPQAFAAYSGIKGENRKRELGD
jgi:hypothetical protein